MTPQQLKAMKLSLEALERCGSENYTIEREAITAIKEALAQPEHDWEAEYIKQVELHNQTLDELRDALAQPEQDVDWEKLYRLEVKKKEALAAKYERDIKPLTKIVPMAQPEQEPVAWISTSPARMIHWTSDKPAYGDDWIPLYTKEQL